MPRYQQSIVFQRCTIINRRLRSRFARVNGVLLFLSAFNSAILTSKPSKSGGCQKKCLLTRTLESSAGPEGAAEEVPDLLHAVAPPPHHAEPQQGTAEESKAGRLRNGRTGGGYVERNACSADSIVISSRGFREDRIGTIKGHAGGGSTETSRGEVHSLNHLAIDSDEVAEIDSKAARTRTCGRSEVGKRDCIQRRRHRCKGKGAGKTGTTAAVDRRPDAEAGIGRIGMARGPAQGADLCIAGY